jgi:hypothetical protein
MAPHMIERQKIDVTDIVYSSNVMELAYEEYNDDDERI